MLYEAFGANGEAYLVQAVTDNPNRTSSEMKFIFPEMEDHWLDQVRLDTCLNVQTLATLLQRWCCLDEGQLSQVGALIETLLEHEDVEDVYCSALEQAKEDD